MHTLVGASEDCDELIGGGSLRRHLAVHLCTCILLQDLLVKSSKILKQWSTRYRTGLPKYLSPLKFSRTQLYDGILSF